MRNAEFINEDAILKDLIETNVRQRGSIGGSDIKLGNRIRELERIYGVRNGSAGGNGGANQFAGRHNVPSSVTEEEIAEKLGISTRTLKYAKKLTDLPLEIQDLVEQGTISPSTASRLIARLTPEEQEKLVASLITNFGRTKNDEAKQRKIAYVGTNVVETENQRAIIAL